MAVPPPSNASPQATSTALSAPDPSAGVILAPHFGVALGVVLLGVALVPLSLLWAPALGVATVIGVFGLFLMAQTALLRLQFSADALVVWRQSKELRRFPYDAWLGWTLFWAPLPVLFYFREQKSVHFLPMLFDAKELRRQLDLHVP
ncbi:DUF3119 family protein [Cyanobium sp. Morenito 9A2]|uniref:DUF3119 family protein n=1 Tax=Cyanobium sp. Morenito 9A2 TaxID=2823718 RepID=UPI0020CEC69B|nr:DUF3119 family protein [Cyanobium sp. Morenito 9A2]MCP9851123.1 DUF3119 family protein [Cyanobium sp. Morenito 9A2]